MSENTQILPQLDMEVLQKKATDYAMAGALKSIEEYYSGYNSPFRKAIDEDLKAKAIDYTLDLPDVISLINESMTKEIDKIVNTCIAKSFMPLVQRFLVRENKEVEFSYILKQLLEEFYDKDPSDFECEVSEVKGYDWLKAVITTPKQTYELTLYKCTNKDGRDLRQILSLPYSYAKTSQTMKVTIEGGAHLELPFTKDVLSDKFLSLCARLLIGDCDIIMDVDDFEEDWFHDGCHC